jgi:hypothetical protein
MLLHGQTGNHGIQMVLFVDAGAKRLNLVELPFDPGDN